MKLRRWEWPDKLIVGFLAVCILLAAVGGAVALVTGGTDEPFATSAPTGRIEAPADTRQALYNGFLDQARSDVAADPNLNCDPDYQQLIIGQVRDATGAEKVILELAMGDACIEAGQYSEAAQYSAYYADAPAP